MTQTELFHEDIYSALRSVVQGLGGATAVGKALWPTRGLKDAEQRLIDCMNPRRAEKLSMDELMLIWRMSREAGIHILAGFIGQEFDYTVTPITKETKKAEIVEQFNRVKGELAEIMRAMERLS